MGRLGACLMVLSVALVAACNRQDTERLSNIGNKLASRAEAATSPVRQQWGAHVASLAASAESRVTARLRWDKMLADAAVEVSGNADTVELKGTVKNEDQRRRAIEIAESTTGVNKVNDSLQILPN